MLLVFGSLLDNDFSLPWNGVHVTHLRRSFVVVRFVVRSYVDRNGISFVYAAGARRARVMIWVEVGVYLHQFLVLYNFRTRM